MRRHGLLPETVSGAPVHPLTLRFRDPAVERAFQEEAGERFRPQVLLTIILGASTWALAGILVPIAYPRVDPAEVALAIGVVELTILTLLFLLSQSHSWDFEQAISGGVNLVGGVAIIVIGGFVADLPTIVAPALLVNMLFAFGLSRLGVVAGVVITVPYVALFAVLVLAGQLHGLGSFDIFLLGVGLSVAVVADYLLESSTRGLFWQRRLNLDQQAALEQEKDKSEALLRNLLPNPIALRLRENPQTLADVYPNVSVLFADIAGFTGIASRIGPSDTVLMLNDLFSRFDEVAAQFEMEKIKTIGDAYMAVAGAPDPLPDHARRAVDMGLVMLAVTKQFAEAERIQLNLRVGVNSGPVVAGVIGRARLAYDLWGDTVNVASRMESHGVEGAIQVTDTVYRTLGDGLQAELRGLIDVRGKGPMQTWLIWPTDEIRLQPAEVASSRTTA